MWTTERPGKDEHVEYYSTYIDKVPDGNILTMLKGSLEETLGPVGRLPESAGDHRYAPGKWTVREFLAHVIDAERVFGFRAFWFARGGGGELPSMDQNVFVASSGASARTLEKLAAEWRAVRAANLAVFEAMDDEAAMRTGIASGYRFTARAFAWIIAGHEIHHRGHFTPRG